jgi:glycosyltransferase involved in cell wall biosynthesis
LDIDFQKAPKTKPVILWNHRWEFDKNPEEFFDGLFYLQKKQIDFELIVLGESKSSIPPIFDKAKKQLAAEILHWGFALDKHTYAQMLWAADIVPITSIQEFFGISLIEAMYCKTYPLVPNRLVYPEHLPEIDFQYSGDLGPILEQLIISGKWKNNLELVRERAAIRSWPEMISVYDELIPCAKRKIFKR